MTFDMRQLKAFTAVARHGGFSAASREVDLTQPTLSTHIAKLEKEVGAKLFDRSGRKVTLTPAGELFLGYANRILSLSTESLEAIQGFTGRVSGEVLIAASTVPGEYLLPKQLAGFAAAYPDVTVTLTITSSSDVARKTADGDAAIGVTGSLTTDPELDSRRMCDDTIVLVASPAAGSALPSQITIDDLKNMPLVRRETGSGTRSVVEAALFGAGMDPESLRWAATLGSTRSVIEAAAAGMGGAFVSRLAAARELDDGALSEIRVQGLGLDRGFYILTAVHRTLSPAAGRVIEMLLETGGQTRQT